MYQENDEQHFLGTDAGDVLLRCCLTMLFKMQTQILFCNKSGPPIQFLEP